VLFLPDDDIPSGGCVVETAEGHVRSSASEHLREIAETLKTVE